jgi:hypothetical protein
MSAPKFYRHVLTAGCSALALAAAADRARAADFIGGDTLLISTTTYQDVGAVANLVAGVSQLPGSNAGQTSTAVSNGALNTVWNNETADPSFGVTSAISLSDLNPNTGAVLASTTINPNIVSTSFSSKSELGLNLTKTSSGYAAPMAPIRRHRRSPTAATTAARRCLRRTASTTRSAIPITDRERRPN